jgi:hypothetical protein
MRVPALEAEGEGFEPSRDQTALAIFETHFISLNHALSGPVRDTTRDSCTRCLLGGASRLILDSFLVAELVGRLSGAGLLHIRLL